MQFLKGFEFFFKLIRKNTCKIIFGPIAIDWEYCFTWKPSYLFVARGVINGIHVLISVNGLTH